MTHSHAIHRNKVQKILRIVKSTFQLIIGINILEVLYVFFLIEKKFDDEGFFLSFLQLEHSIRGATK